MAVTFLTGFESAAAFVDGIYAPVGTGSYSTTQARTGTRSIRCNPASGSAGWVQVLSSQPGYHHFAAYFVTLPTVQRVFMGGATRTSLRINADATVSLYDGNSTLVGTSSVALTTGQWYWFGVRTGNVAPSAVLLQIDGVDQVSGTTSSSATYVDGYGWISTEASAAECYIDDIIIDDAGFLAPSKVALLLPISDYSRDTLWTGGSGGITNLYDAVNNTPPVGSATESNTTQIEHAGGAALTTDTYSPGMTTYTTAGVGASDTVIAVQGVIVMGEDISTGTKLLSWGSTANPTITGDTSIDVSTGHGSGAVGTYSTGTDYWNERRSAIVTSPSVALGYGPSFQVSRPETASRVASVCFMGVYVAWTPYVAPPVSMVFPPKVYPQLLPH